MITDNGLKRVKNILKDMIKPTIQRGRITGLIEQSGHYPDKPIRVLFELKGTTIPGEIIVNSEIGKKMQLGDTIKITHKHTCARTSAHHVIVHKVI